MDDDQATDPGESGDAGATAEGDALAGRLSGGIRPALDRLGAAPAREIAGRAEHQLALWPVGPVDLDDEPEAVETRRGAGRPAGSRNRATVEAAEWILSRYRSPLQFLAETWSRPVELLAAELGCSRADAFKLQQAAAIGAAPYVHRRQPLAIEAGDGNLPVIVMVRPDQAKALQSGEIGLDDVAYEIVEDQGLSAPSTAQSDTAESDRESK